MRKCILVVTCIFIGFILHSLTIYDLTSIRYPLNLRKYAGKTLIMTIDRGSHIEVYERNEFNK